MDDSGTKSVAWNENTVYAIGLYRLICRSIGIWPLDCDDVGGKIRFFVVITLQVILNYELIQEFADGCVSTTQAADFIGVVGSATVSLLKVSIARIHQKEMACLIESAISDWSMCLENNLLEIMRRYANFSRMATIFQFGSAYATVMIIVVSAPPTVGEVTNDFISDSNLSRALLRSLPVGSGCSVMNVSFFQYLALYALRIIQLLSVVNCMLGCDTFLFGISMHLCAQLELLKIRLKRLGRNLGQVQFRNELAGLIKRHNHLVYMIDLVENTFNIVILGQLISSSLHIVLLGVILLIKLKNGDYAGLMYTPIAISSLLFQIYIYCYAGECFSSQAMEVRDAAYGCCWYNFPPSFARSVMLTIVRTNHQSYISAGKIFRMNNKSFTSIIKTLGSFFSVLKLSILS